MKILKPESPNLIYLIPREFLTTNFRLRFRDRDLNKDYTYDYTGQNTDVIFSIFEIGNNLRIGLTEYAATTQFKLVEGRYYDFEYSKFFQSSGETVYKPLYRETVFCTAQEIEQRDNKVYKPNLGSYTEHNTGGNENKFIIID